MKLKTMYLYRSISVHIRARAESAKAAPAARTGLQPRMMSGLTSRAAQPSSDCTVLCELQRLEPHGCSLVEHVRMITPYPECSVPFFDAQLLQGSYGNGDRTGHKQQAGLPPRSMARKTVKSRGDYMRHPVTHRSDTKLSSEMEPNCARLPTAAHSVHATNSPVFY